MASLFYNLLYFIGVRQCGDVTYIKENENSFKNIVKRKMKKYKKITGIDSQPRHITRYIFYKEHNDELSPQSGNRIPSDIKFSIDLNNSNLISRQSEHDDANSISNSCCLKYMELFSDWGYTAFIFLLLLAQPSYVIYALSSTETNDEIAYYSSLFYHLIHPVQYYYCLKYFTTDHFEKFYYRNEYRKFLNKLTILIITLTLLNFSVNLSRIFTDNDFEFPLIESYSDGSKIFILIYLMVYWIYSNLILFVNLTCFVLVFNKHKNNLVQFSQKIFDEKCNLSLNQIMQELSFLVHHFKYSVGKFENIFASFTLLGALSLGFFIERFRNGNIELFPWNNFAIYIIMQAIFFFTILDISGAKNGMSDFIKNPKYISKYVKRYTIDDIEIHFGKDNELNKYIVTNLIEENASLIDFNTLIHYFMDDWVEFKFFGFNIANFSLIKKGIAMVALIFGIIQIEKS